MIDRCSKETDVKLRDSVPKHGGTGKHRECSSEETFARVRPHLRRAGITRIADITGLDRVGIPVFNAIVPRSADEVSVYNGKGGTPADAMTSAVMEAFERFCAWQPMRADRIASYAELRDGPVPVLDPATHNMQPHPLYHHNQPMSWVRGFDLLNEETILVPLGVAGYFVRLHEQPCYKIVTTNGIASGNSLEEAICHALCEVIERDDWSMAELVCHRLRTVVETRVGNAPPGSVQWLEDRHPMVDAGTLPPAAAHYAQMFADAGIQLVIRNITSATGIPSFAALVREDLGPTVSSSHAGYGTHPDAEVAVIRALAEAAQSRAVDLQAMREDLNLPGAKIDKWQQHTYRGQVADAAKWPFGEVRDAVRFGDVPSNPSDDIMTDLRLMLDRLRARGLSRVIAVDLSIPDVAVHVARVIVPGMETFALDQGKLGKRASAMWDGTLRELISRKPVNQEVTVA
jgi:ribosomal protein S12 methylthiotransferase accessory factor